jgi:hypothetical protein
VLLPGCRDLQKKGYYSFFIHQFSEKEPIVKVVAVENVTHDVKRIQCEKPLGYYYLHGQATEAPINKKGWRDEKRSFTFTSFKELPYPEFNIKIYGVHHGVTMDLGTVQVSYELMVRDVWGAIQYQGPG